MSEPKWVMHEGTAHLMKAWDGMSAAVWCGTVIYGVRDVDFREHSSKRGEQECRRCMDRRAIEMKGG